MVCSLRQSRGLTVLEVVATLGILTGVIITLVAVFVSGGTMMQQSSDLTQATDVGREFLETVKFLGYESTTVGVFDGSVPDSPDSVTEFPPAPYPTTRRGNQDFVLRVEVTQHSPVTRLVKVRVAWLHHSTDFTTMVHK